ncbi:NAD(P)H-dependent glycerol-3-phosphate dehydrogenase [soil metagenome]|jgi:glycerol-3-phosphate dehydrogenase (NAD(P)+)|nr:NAD(P)-dependent glycerol-3-phosphate dehydrogenase [Deinococcota bacterium]
MAPVANRLAVIGAGAWGTALAALLAQNGHELRLWARREALAVRLEAERVNVDYLPGLRLPENVLVSADGEAVMAGAEAAFMVVPSKGLRGVLAALPSAPAYVSCAKGLEPGTMKRLSEVIADYHPRAALAALSGPNLAGEIAAGLPAASTVASPDAALAARVQGWLTRPLVRVYSSADLAGVEVAGAVKNVIALAAGMGDGLGLGDNAKASIITRGLAEMVRLGVRLGGQRQTFYGLAGLGDLIATCHSPRSRNRGAGERVVTGGAVESGKTVTEGVRTVEALMDYAARERLELPIARAVYEVIFEGKPAQAALRDLMSRDMKAEW